MSARMIDVLRIDGASQHLPRNQQHVDRAAEVLSKQFGMDYASRELVREHMSKPDSVLLCSDQAVAIILRAGTKDQRLWLMWVRPGDRGNGVGGALLRRILDTFATTHFLRLDCPAEREAFYRRHGFHTLFTAEEGRFCYMAGPARGAEDVRVLLPASRR